MATMPKTPTAVTEDPLADLREPEPDRREPEPEVTEDAPVLGDRLFSEAEQDAAVAVVIAAWHADTTTQGFLHGGGQCGCRYIAGVAVRAILPLSGSGEPED